MLQKPHDLMASRLEAVHFPPSLPPSHSPTLPLSLLPFLPPFLPPSPFPPSSLSFKGEPPVAEQDARR